jgi:hypothetical protein
VQRRIVLKPSLSVASNCTAAQWQGLDPVSLRYLDAVERPRIAASRAFDLQAAFEARKVSG